MMAKAVQQIVARFDAVPFSLTGFMLVLPHTQTASPAWEQNTSTKQT